MIESGVVKRIEKNVAYVVMEKGANCDGCTICQAFGDGSVELMALNEPGAKPGDKVEIEIDPKQVVRYSAIVFLLPVIGLIIGYFLGDSYLFKAGMSKQAAGIVGSLGMMILTFVGIIGYDRMVGKKQSVNARINRVL